MVAGTDPNQLPYQPTLGGPSPGLDPNEARIAPTLLKFLETCKEGIKPLDDYDNECFKFIIENQDHRGIAENAMQMLTSKIRNTEIEFRKLRRLILYWMHNLPNSQYSYRHYMRLFHKNFYENEFNQQLMQLVYVYKTDREIEMDREHARRTYTQQMEQHRRNRHRFRRPRQNLSYLATR
ncbi:MAG: hypothetical protein [Atripovirus timinis]|uniref:Uncharacterized protein n=1 Tax=Cressdnaviricota sp. TaxID=2748378 RepID=A0A345MXV3_9VIRU|nr:MAG: hypothetical protein [Cressdnaviricota sp.]